MTKLQIQSAWREVICETHKRSRLSKSSKYESIKQLGDLLLYAQILLNKIEEGENNIANSIVFRRTIDFYCSQMKLYI